MIKIRKRVILTFFAVITILFVTNKVWLERKPFITEFDIKNAKNVSIKVELNKRYDNDFYPCRTRSSKKEIKNNNEQYVLFETKDVKRVNKIRFIFENLNPERNVVIKNIRLRLGKKYLNQFDKFNAEDGNVIIKNNTLELKPKNSSITLYYEEPINLKSPIRFNFEIFTIILILSALLSYKLMDYVADFSSVQHKSRVDIIFLCLFFIMLFIPMSHISQEKKSMQENRTLATWKPFIKKDGSINYSFGKDYEAWYNDRFNFREYLIKLSNKKLLYTAYNPKGIIDKKNKFLYANFEFTELSDEELDTGFRELVKFKNFLNAHDIKFYILIVPRKSFIHPTAIKKAGDDYKSKISSRAEKNGLKLVYPEKELLQGAKDDYMFFRTDHHWTDSGAFIGYKELIKLIKNDYPNIKALTEDDFNIFYREDVRSDFNRKFTRGQTCGHFYFSDKTCKMFLLNKYKYFTHKDSANLDTIIINKSKSLGKDFYYPKGENLKVILFGTSMNESLSEFVPYNFKYTKRIRNNNVKDMKYNENFKIMKYYKKQILDYKPDIFIMCITLGNLFEIKNIFKD